MRDTTLMLDSEWEDGYKALPDYARAELRRAADTAGVNIRLLDPADYANTPVPEPTELEKQQQRTAKIEAARREKQLRTPVDIPPVLDDRMLKDTARRLGVSFEGYKQAYNEQRAAVIEAENKRKAELKRFEHEGEIGDYRTQLAAALEESTGADLVILAGNQWATPEDKTVIRERLADVWPAGVELVKD